MANRSKVAFVVGTLSDGGAERFVSNALCALDRSRFAPYLVLFRPDIRYPLPPEIPVVVLGKYKARHFPKAIWTFRDWLKKTRPDLVFSAWSIPNFLVGLSLFQLSGGRSIGWIARIANDPEKEEPGIYRHVMHRLYRRADMLVANSQGLAIEFRKYYPQVLGPMRVVNNLVDGQELRRLSREPVDMPHRPQPTVLAVARLFPQKRYDLLLRAFKRVREAVDARLVICGDGPLKAPLVALAAELGLGESVSFEGFVTNPYAWMARADLFVMTSDYEGLPNALLEAQSLGVPAVATDCRFGPAEIIHHGRTGLLVEPGDVGALADSMIYLLLDPMTRRAMGSAARQRIRELYSEDKVMVPLMQALDSVRDEKSRRPI